MGLNLVFLTPGEQGGMEVYARELVHHLSLRGDLRLTAFVNHDATGQTWGVDVAEVLVPVRARDRKQWVIGEQLYLPRLAHNHSCDLVHSLASTAPLSGHFYRVTTIHDLNYKKVPDSHFGLAGLGMRALVPAAARRSHRIVADSQSTANDLVQDLHVPRGKVDVVPLGVGARPPVTPTEEAALRRTLDLKNRAVLLSVSAKRPHKNLKRLIQAHARLADPRPVLVLPGYATPYEDELRHLTEQLGTTSDVRFVGWISREDLEGLYSLALVFAFPSLYEGFGLPPLEAMARGVPVLTSDRGSLREVTGGAALVVDPESVPSIADGLRRLLDDPMERQRLAVAGRVQARSFTWENTAERTTAVYQELVSKGRVFAEQLPPMRRGWA